ncbi:uncharacterized protein LOC132620145 [Lycium barbarum]|uniref:uncharacterized protein LOC132620145 n=1 Tax=Lycium barbarum TaxID=112863 RepID=UPI00293F40E2|nr:uncharacterized protein LOC132620145 [Lycium barbarum]
MQFQNSMKRFFSLVSSKLPQSSSSAPNAPQVEEYLNQLEENHHSAKKQKQGVELDSLWADSKERIPILECHLDEHDEIRRAKKKCEDLMRQEQSIKFVFVNPENKTKLEHKIRLKASIDVVRLLLNQRLTFRGYHEDESSLNKDIITSCKLETIKAIMDDLNGDYFSLLVDISCDVSRKGKMSIVLRYVDRWRFVVERFIGIVHVRDTSGLYLKEAIVNYLAQHSLSLSHTRGQCYDGASNMQGHLSGLKTLIQQESVSAHAIHCFAHQLQLSLVGVSKKCLQVEELVLLVSNFLNVVGGSFKRMDELLESQAEKIQEALDMGEIETGKGLNQELDLTRVANTRWGSHNKYFKNFISVFGSINNVLDTIVVDSKCAEDRAKAKGFLRVC